VPAFVAAADLHLVEVNEALRASQREALLGRTAAVTWHDFIEDVPDGAAIVIANEFLDALPIRQFVGRNGAWHERTVELSPDGRLQFGETAVAAMVQPGAPPHDGDIVEVRPGEDELIAGLTRRTAPLAALFIDYGPADAEQGDTLQAVRGHIPVDLFAAPGMSDITAHVRFGPLADKARGAGFTVDTALTQAEFLGRLGAVERASRLMAASPEHAASVEAGIARLLSPQGMGTRFKVLAMRSPRLPPLPAFG
jgi:SAM-dependent MidA family methyltransferase